MLGLWLEEVEEEGGGTVEPGDDGPDRKAEETGSGQTAAGGWGPPTALAHLCGGFGRQKKGVRC